MNKPRTRRIDLKPSIDNVEVLQTRVSNLQSRLDESETIREQLEKEKERIEERWEDANRARYTAEANEKNAREDSKLYERRAQDSEENQLHLRLEISRLRGILEGLGQAELAASGLPIVHGYDPFKDNLRRGDFAAR